VELYLQSPVLNNGVHRDQFAWPNFSFTWTYLKLQEQSSQKRPGIQA